MKRFSPSATRSSVPALLVLLLLGGALCRPAQAQTTQDTPLVINFARPGQATISVHAWGAVGRPGIWRIERDTDLIQFLSAAQVPGMGIDEPGVRERVLVSIYRSSDGNRRQVYSERLSDVLAEGASYPALQEGDVIEVKNKRRRTVGFQTVAQVVGTASTLTLLILRLTSGQ